MAGAHLAQQIFWVPQSGDIGMGVSILSYAGKVQFGLITDTALTPDPEAVIGEFEREFDSYLYHVLLEAAVMDESGADEAATADEPEEPAPVLRKRPKRLLA